jgi:hypothetical protein
MRGIIVGPCLPEGKRAYHRYARTDRLIFLFVQGMLLNLHEIIVAVKKLLRKYEPRRQPSRVALFYVQYHNEEYFSLPPFMQYTRGS